MSDNVTCSQCGIAIDNVQARMSSRRADNAKPACKDCVTRELTRVDFTISDHGSIWLVHPNNDTAREHLETNVDGEAQWWTGSLAVESRYIVGLVQALESEGFTFVINGGLTL